MTDFPLSAAEFLPQKGPMQFVDRLESVVEGEAEASADIRGNLFSSPPMLDPVAMVELLAQGCAAFNGYRNRQAGGAVREGFLAGITRFEFKEAPVLEDRVTVRLREDSVIPPFTIVSGEVLQNDLILATGSFKVWESEGELPKPELPEITAADVDSENSLLAKAQNLMSSLTELEKDIFSCGTILKSGEDSLSVRLCFPPDFIGFRGHFPDFPLLPGVIILKTVQLLSSLASGRRKTPLSLKRIKFAQPVFPGERTELDISSADGWQTVCFSLTGDADSKRASGQLFFAGEDDA